MKAYYIKVSGVVQGVFFRKFTVEKATELGLHGYVRNCADGSVEIEAEGDEERLKEFIQWCHHGPDRAFVSKLEKHEQELKNYNGFKTKW